MSRNKRIYGFLQPEDLWNENKVRLCLGREERSLTIFLKGTFNCSSLELSALELLKRIRVCFAIDLNNYRV